RTAPSARPLPGRRRARACAGSRRGMVREADARRQRALLVSDFVNPMRSLLLAGSRSAWLQRQAPNRRFVKLAGRRCRPGETLDEALVATGELNRLGIGVTLTNLGENLRERAEADAVLAHYRLTLDRIRDAKLHAEVSVKPTQLGLDIDRELCIEHMRAL